MTPKQLTIIALLCCSCEQQHSSKTTEDDLRMRAEKYACTKEEQIQMEKYFTVCMTGAGYFSPICLDRATVASCHERSDGSGGAP
jgi:hypothetical protein